MYLFCDIRDYSWSRYLNNVPNGLMMEESSYMTIFFHHHNKGKDEVADK